LFFLTHAVIPNSKGNPFSGGTKYTGVGEIGDFRWKSQFISETVRDSRWLLWNVNSKSWVLDRMVSFSMTFSDLNPGFRSLYTYKSNISKMVHFRDKLTKEH